MMNFCMMMVFLLLTICEQAGDLLLKVIEHPKTTQAQKDGDTSGLA